MVYLKMNCELRKNVRDRKNVWRIYAWKEKRKDVKREIRKMR